MSRRTGAFLAIGTFGVAVLALAGCASPKPPAMDAELKLFAESGSAAARRGELDRAESFWVKALQRARLRDDRAEIVRTAYNLGLCRMTAARYDAAKTVLKLADALAGTRGDERVRILLAESEVARLEGNAEESGRYAAEALSADADGEQEVQAWLLRAESDVAGGRLQAALEHYREAAEDRAEVVSPMIRARLDAMALLLVEAQVMKGNETGLLLSRAGWLKQAGDYREMSVTLGRVADRYAARSEWPAAFDCRVRAIQSMVALGDRERAGMLLKQASVEAERTGRGRDRELVKALAGELKGKEDGGSHE